MRTRRTPRTSLARESGATATLCLSWRRRCGTSTRSRTWQWRCSWATCWMARRRPAARSRRDGRFKTSEIFWDRGDLGARKADGELVLGTTSCTILTAGSLFGRTSTSRATPVRTLSGCWRRTAVSVATRRRRRFLTPMICRRHCITARSPARGGAWCSWTPMQSPSSAMLVGNGEGKLRQRCCRGTTRIFIPRIRRNRASGRRASKERAFDGCPTMAQSEGSSWSGFAKSCGTRVCRRTESSSSAISHSSRRLRGTTTCPGTLTRYARWWMTPAVSSLRSLRGTIMTEATPSMNKGFTTSFRQRHWSARKDKSPSATWIVSPMRYRCTGLARSRGQRNGPACSPFLPSPLSPPPSCSKEMIAWPSPRQKWQSGRPDLAVLERSSRPQKS
mmetsp:Transcript_17314/g.65988  ORF Transcript_17314/g.65988 Transcript_17314/m.65988 type:complete len:390 (-) Transcript_17314:98-1267(-)